MDKVQVIDQNNNDVSKEFTVEDSINNQINLLEYLKKQKNDRQ